MKTFKKPETMRDCLYRYEKEGIEAAKNNKKITACPYPPLTLSSDFWLKGYSSEVRRQNGLEN